MVKNTEDVELQRVGEYLESRRRIQNHGRRLKAYHESGHAVMANHFGLDVLYISLIPNDESAARCKRRHIDTTLLNPEDLRTLARLEMLILYAGHAAQSLMERHGKPHSSKYIADHWGSSDDFSAGMWARQIVGDVEDNATRAEAQAYEKANRAFRDWMVTTAYRLIRSKKLRPAVVALAKELLVKEELTGEEAREIIERSRLSPLRAVTPPACPRTDAG